MKYFFVVFILALCNSISAQSLPNELDKIREVKMLESTRGDIKRILAGYKSDDEDEESNEETFTSEKMDVEVSYTTGDCSDEADETDEWNVPKGKVKVIKIIFTDSVTPDELQLDLSDFKKEQTYANVENEFSYYAMDLGISIYVEENEIERIVVFPALNKNSLLCKNEKNEKAEKLRKVYSNESIFFVPKLEDRIKQYESGPARVTELTLSEYEIAVSCSAVDPKKNKNCSIGPGVISVSTTANDAEGDMLVYEYIVSGGRIVGEGKNVIWDLADVKPGKYTITAGVDDGCGICGETKTKEVVVK